MNNNNKIKISLIFIVFFVLFLILKSNKFLNNNNFINNDNNNEHIVEYSNKYFNAYDGENNNNNNNNNNKNKINKNLFGSFIKHRSGKNIKIADKETLKDYPFQNQIDIVSRYNSYYFELKTSQYKRFPEIGKRVHYCKDVNGENVAIVFQKMYPGQESTLELYFNHYFDFPTEEIPSIPPNSKVPRVLHTLEPPYLRFCTEYEHCSNKFNWSVSYERTADIRTGHCDDDEIFQVLPWELDKFVMFNKTKFSKEFNRSSIAVESNLLLEKYEPDYPLASWFCSKCNIHLITNRMEYVKEMMKFIRIDSYGSCLNTIEPSNKTSRLADDAMDVKQSIISNYKFYLAFESSNCLDYSTEKPLHALKVGSVPIVMAHPQTLKYLPEGSYIYVGDFRTAKELTDYLKYLDRNNDEYLKYFDWRFNQSIIEKWREVNGYPFRPNNRNWVCPLFRHYQNWSNGIIPSKTLHSIPYHDLCLPPNFIKV